jgi:hypothetical protein
VAATSQNPRSLRCDRSIKILNRLQAPISSERRRPAFGDCGRNASRVLIRFRRLGSVRSTKEAQESNRKASVVDR